MSSDNPLPFFAPRDVTTPDHAVLCSRLTPLQEAGLGWKVIRLLRLLENVPVIP